MTNIINTLLKLKAEFAEHDGEILSITLNKAGNDILASECQRFCSHTCIGDICPKCGRVLDNMILGIKIKKDE